MLYVILIALGVLALEYYLANYVIAGLIIPLTSAMGLIMAFLVMLTAGGNAGEDPFYVRSLLLFLFLTASSFLMYYRKRRQEYREGYMNDEQRFDEKAETEREEDDYPRP